MTMKFILTVAVAAFALAGGSLAATGDAFAKDGKGSPGSFGSSHTMHVSSGVRHDRDPSGDHRDRDAHEHRHDDDHRYAHRHEHDHSRHFWHGTWWDYGVGSCWQWSDDDEYVWVCD
jgi:hypothetical protein